MQRNGSSSGRTPEAPRDSSSADEAYSRTFRHLCHLVALSRNGKTKAAIDSLTITTISLCHEEVLRDAADVIEAADAYFGLKLRVSDVQSSIDRGLDNGTLVRRSTDRALTLTAAVQAAVEQRVADSDELERAVRQEWSLELRALALAESDEELDRYWSCLQAYMARAFRQHGALATELLGATARTAMNGSGSLTTAMDAAIEEKGLGAERAQARKVLASFFETTTAQRARYVAQLLDATFTFFALTVSDATASYLNRALQPLQLFLDTNYIFGLLDLHENPLSAVSKELVRFIRDHKLPFTLYVHERTLKEFEVAVRAVSERIVGRHWSQQLSRAALSAADVSGVEATFHRLNAEAPLDPGIYFSKFDNVLDLLSDYGVKLYRTSADPDVTEKGLLIAEYKAYVEKARPEKPKPYEALDHDICVWMTLQGKRKAASSALEAGALFLSNDVLFYHVDWRVLRKRQKVGTVVLPGQLLQVLRPFVPATDDFDRRFVEAFAAPEFRTAHSDYQQTIAGVLSFLTAYRDVPENTAVRILTNELLMSRLEQVEPGSAEYQNLVESELFTDNGQLLEERDALERQLAEARNTAARERDRLSAELSAREAELRTREEALGEARAEADQRETEARADERQRAELVVQETLEGERTRRSESLRGHAERRARHLGFAVFGLILSFFAAGLVTALMGFAVPGPHVSWWLRGPGIGVTVLVTFGNFAGGGWGWNVRAFSRRVEGRIARRLHQTALRRIGEG